MNKETEKHILNILRRGTVTWSVRNDCLNKGRRKKIIGKTLKGKEKFWWENQCSHCKKWFLLKSGILEVDHVDPVQGFKGNFDEFIRRMYCDPSNLQLLCSNCHKRKTNIGNATTRFQRKNKEALDEL